ncbi:MAG: glycogen/starch/alpha-glucan phosphorylase [Terrisporobacter othiniensis]|uniref:glycogen/starch/alpha-glucan phosphorylase n=1 Tax=Terrisporobacter petrolearius TaxID=1460447 RepID=UPI0022DF679C|nr:glycogen/starch/alpha-glucan phosphorylase [Terrisporobacter petrolearius]MDU4861441.1 glycogen/starch/alpha-glucan phosphorylase [Terrisporobacter othiniensis]MDU6994610.1 glycogen/starch/alpha-glucan phosphorylase [Terrisporobacter othiniensis]
MITINKKRFKEHFRRKMNNLYAQTLEEASNEELFNVLCYVIKDMISKDWEGSRIYQEKAVFYFSIEFLLGRQLKSNLLNLGFENTVRQGLSELGINLDEIVESEPDPALGNGGLGRLAACFLDSMACVGISGHGYGIRYKYGLFEQKFVNNSQVEVPDNWLINSSYSWETVRPNRALLVKYEGKINFEEDDEGNLKVTHKDYIPVMAMPYDIPIIGYENECINTLRIWKSEIPTRDFGKSSLHAKNQAASYEDALKYKYYAEEISQTLYPNDSNYAGQLLRLKQEYFFVSAGIQDIFRKCRRYKITPQDLPNKIAIHINDTHPALCIPEMMRILLDEEGLSWDESWNITIKVMSYTNHTILCEAMERWSEDIMKKLLPRMYMIIEEINRIYVNNLRKKGYSEEKVKRMAIMYDGEIRMANLCIVSSYSINGVAQLHTKLLKEEVLNDFYEEEPYKFNNKTNGIAHRRWLISSNPELANLIIELIGDKWIKDTSHLKELEKFVDDEKVLNRLEKIKFNNKVRLANYIKENNNITIDPNSIFDVQVKRLHAYKRQLMNILHVLCLYHEILDNGDIELDIQPRTFIFGAKAAPGYYLAKCIIKLINCVANLVNNDPRVKDKIKVVFIENYGVSLAEKIIPAANVSEQISTTTKEASGTSNMKFMMNGALTLATLDGANVEIYQQVGKDNMFLFGLSAKQVLDYNKYGGYSSKDLYHSNKLLRRVVDDLVNGFIPGLGKEGREIYDALITYNDEYFVLRDIDEYAESQQKISNLYKDKMKWNKMSLINIANSGIFSSDRTINEYIEDIWFKGCDEDVQNNII